MEQHPHPHGSRPALARRSPGSDPAAAPQAHGTAPAPAPPPASPSPSPADADPAASTEALNPLVPLDPEPEDATLLEPAPFDPTPFDPVPLRARHDGWTPERQRAFVEALAETLSREAAAASVGMSVESARRLRRRPGAEGFAAACDAALRRGLAERGRAAIVDEAVNGRLVRRYYHGQLISEERVRSPRLLLALLERADALFAGPGAAESEAAAADWEGSLDRLEEGGLEGGHRVWRAPDGHWRTSFPPPPGFQAEGDPAAPGYSRRLSEAEEKALDARSRARLAEGAAARDRYFGFSPGRGITYRRTRPGPAPAPEGKVR